MEPRPQVEGSFEWVSSERPGYTPSFGPFEAGNGAGEDEDCVALCKSDCGSKNASECVDLSEYGYTGTFLIDDACSSEYAFCCDGYASEHLARASTSPRAAQRTG